jgi:arsenite methyltransferase
MNYVEIDKRYSTLAAENCCLSCGGAIDHSKATLGEVCVDLGSGRGNDVLRLAQEVGEKGFVYGIDISEGMVSKSRSVAEKLGIKNVIFQRAELETLPIDTCSVDLVISNCTINHATEKEKVWFEIARILKYGGRFVVSDIYSIDPVPDEYRNDPLAVSECWAGAVTRTEYFNQLRNAGFSEIEILEESKPYLKGKIEVASITLKGKISGCCCSSLKME